MAESEINRRDLVSDEALKAPLVLRDNLEQALKSIDKIIAAGRKMEMSLVAAKTIGQLRVETQQLAKSQQELSKTQETIITSTKQYVETQKSQVQQTNESVKATEREAKSLNELVTKRDALKRKIRDLNKDQKEDLTLLKNGTITRAEYNKRLQESNVEIAKTQQRLNLLNREVKQSITLTTTIGGAYTRLTTQLEQARVKYKDLAASGTASNEQLKRQQAIVQDLNKKVQGIDKTVGQFVRNVGNYPNTFAAAAASVRSLVAAFGLVTGVALFAKVLKSVVQLTIDYERANSTLKAVLSANGKEMASLRKQQLELGRTTEYTSKEVADLQLELARLGFPTKDIREMTKSTLDAALAMGTDLGRAAALTGATLKIYGLEAKEAGRVNDVLSKSTAASALNFSKLETSMSIVGPVADKLGFSLEDSVALLGELSNAGFSATTAATATRNILLNLADANGKLAKRIGEPVKDLPSLVAGLDKLKKEGVKLAEALELTDVRSVSAFSTFLKGGDSVVKLSEVLKSANGAAAEMALTIGSDLQGDVKKLTSAWEGLVLTLLSGDSIFSKVLSGIVRLTTSFIDLITPVEETTKALEKERLNLNVLVRQIQDTNKNEEERKRLLKELNKEYPTFLKNLDQEKITNEQLSLRLEDVNKQFQRKIALVAAEEVLLKQQREITESLVKERELRKDIAVLEENLKSIQNQTGSLVDIRRDYTNQIALKERLIVEEGEKRIGLQKELNELTDELVKAQDLFNSQNNDYFEQQKEIIKTKEKEVEAVKKLTIEELKALNRLAELRKELELEEINRAIKLSDRKEELIRERVGKEVELELLKKRNLLAELENDTEKSEKEKEAARQLILLESIANIKNLEVKAEEDISEEKLRVQSQFYEDAKALAEKYLADKQQALDEEVAAIQKAVLSGQLTRAKGDRLILLANRNASKELIQAQIASLQQLLIATVENEQKQLLAVAENEEQIAEIKRRSAQEQVAIKAELAKLEVSLVSASYEMQTTALQDWAANTTEVLQKVQSLYQQFTSAISELFHNLSEQRVQELDAELEKEREVKNTQIEEEIARRELLLENEALNEEQRLAIKESSEQREDQLRKQIARKEAEIEKRKLKERQKLAKYDKAVALVQAAINTALGITSALTLPPPASFILAALTAALGAVQIAAIASKPIPAAEKGMRDHKGGPILVGEKGSEIINIPHKGSYLSPGVPTIIADLPKHSEVIPHEESMARIASEGLSYSGRGDKLGNFSDLGIRKDLKSLEKAVRNKKEVLVEGRVSGYRSGGTRVKYIESLRNR